MAPISKQRRDITQRMLVWTAIPVFGWLWCYARGFAWVQCQDCGWWMLSGDQDLTMWDLEHVEGLHPG
jgi:hypothetical protein